MYSPSTLSAFHVCLRWICTSVTWNRRTLWYTCIYMCDVVTITASAYCYLLTIHYHVHVNQFIYFNYIFLVVAFICQFTSLISDWTGLMFIYGYVCLCFVRLLFVHIEYWCHVTNVSNIYTVTEDFSYYCTCITSHPTDTTWLMSCTLTIVYVTNAEQTHVYIVTINVIVDWCLCQDWFMRRCMLCATDRLWGYIHTRLNWDGVLDNNIHLLHG